MLLNIFIAYLLIAIFAYNLEILTDWLGVQTAGHALLYALAWPVMLTASAMDAALWLKSKVKF
jgi:hypothetical protein